MSKISDTEVALKYAESQLYRLRKEQYNLLPWEKNRALVAEIKQIIAKCYHLQDEIRVNNTALSLKHKKMLQAWIDQDYRVGLPRLAIQLNRTANLILWIGTHLRPALYENQERYFLKTGRPKLAEKIQNKRNHIGDVIDRLYHTIVNAGDDYHAGDMYHSYLLLYKAQRMLKVAPLVTKSGYRRYGSHLL